MNERTRLMTAALLVGLTVSSTLTGCAPGGETMNDADVATAIESAVVDAIPGANGAYAAFGSDGSPSRRTVFVRVYLDSPGVPPLDSVATATLETAWKTMPSKPSSIGFQAVDGEKPATVKRVTLDNIDLTGLDRTIGAGTVGLGGQMLSLTASELTDRFGTWTKPAGG